MASPEGLSVVIDSEVPHMDGIDVERFYGDLLFALGEHAQRGGTAVGAAAVAKRVARGYGLASVDRLPLPRLTRAERDELTDRTYRG
jgi:hypothetical protein